MARKFPKGTIRYAAPRRMLRLLNRHRFFLGRQGFFRLTRD